MFRKIVDIIKEVFWIKPSPKKRKPVSRRIIRKTVKKKIVKKITKPQARPKPKSKPDLPVPKKTVKPVKSAAKAIDPSLSEVGVITHYFDRIKVAVVKLTQGTVLIGDKLTIFGPKTKFVQKVWSLQIESEDVKVAKKGQVVGLKIDKIVGIGDKVYK